MLSFSQTIEVDTVLEGYPVTFEANQDLDSYEWKIGSDGRTWNEKKVSLDFGGCGTNGCFAPTTINITLKGKRVRKEVDSICNPNIKIEEQTTTKKLVVMPYNSFGAGANYTKPALVGNYEGFEISEPTKKYTVEVGFKPSAYYGGEMYMYFKNLIDGCDFSYNYNGNIEYWSEMEPHYTAGLFSDNMPVSNTNCREGTSGEALLFLNSTKDSITIRYNSYYFPNKVFKGKRKK